MLHEKTVPVRPPGFRPEPHGCENHFKHLLGDLDPDRPFSDQPLLLPVPWLYYLSIAFPISIQPPEIPHLRPYFSDPGPPIHRYRQERSVLSHLI